MSKKTTENYEIVGDSDDDDDDDIQDINDSDKNNDMSDLNSHDFGSYSTKSTDTTKNSINLDLASMNSIFSTFKKNQEVAATPTRIEHDELPAKHKIIYVNPGFTSTLVDMSSMATVVVARTMLADGYAYIATHGQINKKLSISVAILPVNIPQRSIYNEYLKRICEYMREAYPIRLAVDTVGIPILKIGKKDLMLCGCCGVQMSNVDAIKHAQTKVALFEKFNQKKWSCCPWCEIEFDTDEACLLHWFDENHTIVACRNIIGETDGSVNDARLHLGMPLPYTPFIQSALSVFLQLAPLAAIILAQKVTKIDLANTNELPACLSVEIASAEKGESWIPDCSACNERYYLHNVVHYSSIGAYDKNSKYEKRACGHYIPAITKGFLRSIGLSLFDDLADKLEGVKRRYGCSTYKTSARKDQYDDEGPMRKRFTTLLETYRGSSTATSAQYVDSVLTLTYRQQTYHQATMSHEKGPAYSSYSRGKHIEVQQISTSEGEYDMVELMVEVPNEPCNETPYEPFDEQANDEEYDDYGYVHNEPPELKPKKKNTRTKYKPGKENINNKNNNNYNNKINTCKIQVPFDSTKYSNTKTRLGFLVNRPCMAEYNVEKCQEYRIYRTSEACG